MDSSGTLDRLLVLVTDCAGAQDAATVLRVVLRSLPAVCGADEAVLVATTEADADRAADWDADWDTGFEHVERRQLPGHVGALVLGWHAAPPRPDPLLDAVLDAVLALLDTTLARRQAEEEYADLAARVDNAQHLAGMGDYDWHIASDSNRWSDELFRIYGYEPQSFNASYDRFLEMVHPDDRDRIAAVHREAYRTGEPYHMVERIIRPDGEVRHLLSNGQVLQDDQGTPLRFRGTCLDITERVLAEQQTEAIATRMAEDRLRQRQALELNDSVVQGLVAASYALQLDDHEQASAHVEETLAAARGMLDDLLQSSDDAPPAPGDLVRRTPAGLSGEAS